MITLNGLGKRYNEMKNYGEQQFDMSVAEQRGYVFFGGSKRACLALKEAVKEVFGDLRAKCKNVRKELLQEFLIPKNFEQEFSEEERFGYSSNLWVTNELTKLLKTKGTLRKMLGQEEEKRLYDDFYVYKEKVYGLPYNPFSYVNNCLQAVRKETEDNETALASILNISPSIVPIKKYNLRKKDTVKDRSKEIETQRLKYADSLNTKLLSGRTIKEEYEHALMNERQKSFDEKYFDHKMLNLAYTGLLQEVDKNPSFFRDELVTHLSKKELIEYFAGKPYNKLTTYEKSKVTKMVFDKTSSTFTFFERTPETDFKFIQGHLYTIEQKLRANSELEIILYFNTRMLTPFTDKRFVYSNNSEFEKLRQKDKEFWQHINKASMENVLVGKLLKNIGKDRISRLKNNKFFQGVSLNLLDYIKGCYYPCNLIRLGKDRLNKVLGDIESVVQSLSFVGKNRPLLAESIVKLIRIKTFWVGQECKWLYDYTPKDENNMYTLIPNRKYFEKEWSKSLQKRGKPL
jgi:hypothetical protein